MPRRIHPHWVLVTSLSCYPRPRRRDRGSLFLSLSPPSSPSLPPSLTFFSSSFTLFFESSYALRRRRVSPGRKFHPRIAQLIPRSFPCQPASQPARRTTTPRRRCVLSKLDTYRSTPVQPLVLTDLFLLPSLFFPSLKR